MRGAIPKPIEQHRAEGTYRAGRHARTPVLIAGRPSKKPSCPPWLSEEGQKAFGHLVDMLWRAGFLDKADEMLIAVAADALGDAVVAAEDCNVRGLTVEATRITRTGDTYTVTEKNPSYQVKADAFTRFHRVCADLGIGPVARARLANMGARGASPALSLPGLGTKPTPLAAIAGAKSDCG